MLIELRYQCYIHACSGNYLGNIFSFFCVKRRDGVFQDNQTVLLYVRTMILVVQTIQLIHPNVNSSSLDERVFTISMWHYVRTSLKFRPDGESCRVKSYSARFAALLFAFFGSFLSSCAFSLCFLCVTL
jgi:hypothetical protein